MEMPGRHQTSENYRFGFNGQEKDDEVKGDANHVDFKFRAYDPRLGKFLSVDPLASEYPWNSPYAFSENNVIHAIELEGLEKYITILEKMEDGSIIKVQVITFNDVKGAPQRLNIRNKKTNENYSEYEVLRVTKNSDGSFSDVEGSNDSSFEEGIINSKDNLGATSQKSKSNGERYFLETDEGTLISGKPSSVDEKESSTVNFRTFHNVFNWTGKDTTVSDYKEKIGDFVEGSLKGDFSLFRVNITNHDGSKATDVVKSEVKKQFGTDTGTGTRKASIDVVNQDRKKNENARSFRLQIKKNDN